VPLWCWQGTLQKMSDDLDETIEASFPASDAPANTPETGIGVNGDRDAPPAPEPPEPPEPEEDHEN
jgi:hypothetical protein